MVLCVSFVVFLNSVLVFARFAVTKVLGLVAVSWVASVRFDGIVILFVWVLDKL